MRDLFIGLILLASMLAYYMVSVHEAEQRSHEQDVQTQFDDATPQPFIQETFE